MNNLNKYMSEFFIKGVYLLCSDNNESYDSKLINEKSFICGSFWAISSLSTSECIINQEDLIKMLSTLRRCIKTSKSVEKNKNRGEHTPSMCTNMMKGFREYSDPNLYETNVQSTLYAIQIYYMVKRLRLFQNYKLDNLVLNHEEVECIINYVKHLYDKKLGFFYNSNGISCNGSNDNNDITAPNNPFKSDLRHTMAALCTLTLCYKLLDYSDEKVKKQLENGLNIELIYKNIKRHFNDDGGMSLQIGGESNVAACFCGIGSIIFINKLGSLSKLKIRRLVSWLLERISISGGVNGRVGKSNDICYIWWNLATLMLIRKNYPESIKLFNENVTRKVLEFIATSQNADGGFSCNKSSSTSDPYHTFTALLSISLLKQYLTPDSGLNGSITCSSTDAGVDTGPTCETSSVGLKSVGIEEVRDIDPLFAIPCNGY